MASYKVIFLGLSVIGLDEETRLLEGLQKKFNLTPERAESLLQRVPIVVKKGLAKGEAERYVKVFEEIGGRVKVEEEEEQIPTLDITRDYEAQPRGESKLGPKPEPKPAFAQRPEPEKRVPRKGIVICPQCGFEQPETDECIKCGVIMSKFVQFQEMARSYEGQVREISSKEYTPWESGEGFIVAFFKTTQEALFSPTKFFKKTAAGEGYWSPLIYGLIAGIIGNGCAILWFWLFVAQLIPMDRIPFQHSLSIVRLLIPLPFQLAIGMFVGGAIIHLCLMLVGGNKQGYKTTFRAVCYSYSALLFNVIPFIGSVIGFIYRIILFILGVREGHGIRTGKAVLAVLLPVIVIFVLIVVAAVLVMMFIGSTGLLGGVRT